MWVIEPAVALWCGRKVETTILRAQSCNQRCKSANQSKDWRRRRRRRSRLHCFPTTWLSVVEITILYINKLSFATSWSTEKLSRSFQNRRVWGVWKEIVLVFFSSFSIAVYLNKDSKVSTDTNTAAESHESIQKLDIGRSLYHVLQYIYIYIYRVFHDFRA